MEEREKKNHARNQLDEIYNLIQQVKDEISGPARSNLNIASLSVLNAIDKMQVSGVGVQTSSRKYTSSRG